MKKRCFDCPWREIVLDLIKWGFGRKTKDEKYNPADHEIWKHIDDNLADADGVCRAGDKEPNRNDPDGGGSLGES